MRSFRRRNDVKTRRRFVVAYVLSIAVHLAIGAFFVVRALLAPIGGSSAAPAGETIAVTRDAIATRSTLQRATAPSPEPTPQPTSQPTARSTSEPSPARSTPRALATIVPPPVVRPVPAAPPRASRTTPRLPELSVVTPNGTPQPQRIAVVAPPVTAPPTAEPSAVPTAPAAPSFAPLPTAAPAT
ncbi:MAG: hypothetical protein IAI50_03425, partial [Candidatus Eremiobacteraeota bacterium]|nr:hypothetical protein [Candidatus Eremiobacteraeota bacterium]